MGLHEHRAHAPKTLSAAVLSVSTTRSLDSDESGRWIAQRASDEGLRVVAHEMVTDAVDPIRRSLTRIIAAHTPHAVIVTGGTGASPRDVTIEAVKPLFSKELTAFPVLFATLSHAQIGAAAMLSRAAAGIIGRTAVFCIPGSLNACKLACGDLIFPELGHLVHHTREP
jgi:molybdenum cofactor biosynthesis protein B